MNGTALSQISSVEYCGSKLGLLLVFYRYVSHSGTDTISCVSTGITLLLLAAVSFTGVANTNPIEGMNSSSAQPNTLSLTATAGMGPGSPGRRIIFVSLANVFYEIPKPSQHPPCATYSSTSMTDIVHGTTEDPLCLNSAAALDIAFQDSSVSQSPTSTFDIQPVLSTDQYEGPIFALIPSSTSTSNPTFPAVIQTASSLWQNLNNPIIVAVIGGLIVAAITGIVAYISRRRKASSEEWQEHHNDLKKNALRPWLANVRNILSLGEAQKLTDGIESLWLEDASNVHYKEASEINHEIEDKRKLCYAARDNLLDYIRKDWEKLMKPFSVRGKLQNEDMIALYLKSKRQGLSTRNLDPEIFPLGDPAGRLIVGNRNTNGSNRGYVTIYCEPENRHNAQVFLNAMTNKWVNDNEINSLIDEEQREIQMIASKAIELDRLLVKLDGKPRLKHTKKCKIVYE